MHGLDQHCMHGLDQHCIQRLIKGRPSLEEPTSQLVSSDLAAWIWEGEGAKLALPIPPPPPNAARAHPISPFPLSPQVCGLG